MPDPRMSNHQRTLSNDELLEEWEIIQAAQRDAAQFRPLYNRYYTPIFRYIYRRTENEALAADICSRVFMSALQKIDKYKYKGVPFSAWLYRIASNEVVQHYRNQQKNRTVSLETQHLNDLIDEEYTGGTEHKIKTMLKALNELAENDMQLIELRFFEQRPFKEIADILEITENNAKVKTYRILDRLRTRIKHYLQSGNESQP